MSAEPAKKAKPALPKISLPALPIDEKMAKKLRAWWNGVEYVENSEEENQENADENVKTQDNTDESNNSDAIASEDSETISENIEEKLPEKEIKEEVKPAPIKEEKKKNNIDEKPKAKQVQKEENVHGVLNLTKDLMLADDEDDLEEHGFDCDQITLYAAQSIFKNGRTTPADDLFDCKILQDINMQENKQLALFGGEGGARACSIIKDFNVCIDSYYDNSFLRICSDEFLQEQNYKIKSNYASFDFIGNVSDVPRNKYDYAVLMYRGSSYECSENHIFATHRLLKSGGIAVWFDFFAPETIHGNGEGGRSFLSEEEIIRIFGVADFQISKKDDFGALFLNTYFSIQKNLQQDFEESQAFLRQHGGVKAANTALSLLIMWKARVEAVKKGNLLVKRYIVAKP